MEVLTRIALVAVALGGCYRPELQDCTVTCAGADECAAGQMCADGWCVAPAAVGTCGERPDANPSAPDANPSAIDAIAPDAAPPDAAGAELHVIVEGRGKVVIDPLGAECVGTQGTPGDCTFPVAPDTDQTLLPVDTSPAATFAGWTTANCSGNAGECTLTIPVGVTLVGASFQ